MDKRVFDELMDKGIITIVGLDPEKFIFSELENYGYATSLYSDDVYNETVNKLINVEEITAQFLADVKKGGNVVVPMDLNLTSPIVIEKDVVIDLNKCTIKSINDVFEVKSGSLTINGDGFVHAATDNTCSWCAVYAHGKSTVEINGGEYKIGAPAGDYNDLIYAKDDAVITINGGKFYIDGTTRASDNVSFMLNLKDKTNAKIIVKGGIFEGTNPAAAKTEPGGDYNFVAEGYESVKDGNNYVVCPVVDIVVDDAVE